VRLGVGLEPREPLPRFPRDATTFVTASFDAADVCEFLARRDRNPAQLFVSSVLPSVFLRLPMIRPRDIEAMSQGLRISTAWYYCRLHVFDLSTSMEGYVVCSSMLWCLPCVVIIPGDSRLAWKSHTVRKYVLQSRTSRTSRANCRFP
jgi:hypothetical protein